MHETPLSFLPLPPTKCKISLLKFLAESFLTRTSALAWQANSAEIPTCLSPLQPLLERLISHANKKCSENPMANSPSALARNGNSQGSSGSQEGGRNAAQRGCMRQSSFPTATRPRGHPSSCCEERAASIPPPCPSPFAALPALRCPSRPPAALGKQRPGLAAPSPLCPTAALQGGAAGEGQMCLFLIDFGEKDRQPRYCQIN